MFGRKLLVFAVCAGALLGVSVQSHPANAIRNGNDETSNPLVMSFELGCSAAVVAPHIVLTAAHCLGDDGFKPFSFTKDGELVEEVALREFEDGEVRLNVPGVRRTSNKEMVSVKYAIKPMMALGLPQNQGPIYDFMALVVHSPLVVDSLPLASAKQIRELKENRSVMFAIGYGLKTPGQGNNEYSYPSSSVVRMIANGDLSINGWPEFGRYGSDAEFNNVLVNFPENSGAGNGDSGSPLYALIDDQIHYVGAMSNVFCITATTPDDDPLRSDKTCKSWRGAGYFTAAGFPNIVDLAFALSG